MSELIQRIPGRESLLGAFKLTQDNSRQLKSRQKLSGASGQLGYWIETNAAWDVVQTFPTTPPYTVMPAEYRLTFTGDGSQKFPIVQPATDIRINGTGEANKLTLSPDGLRYWYWDGTNLVQEYYLDILEAQFLEDEYKLSWLIAFDYMGSVTLRMKARGSGSCNGTWSFERLH